MKPAAFDYLAPQSVGEAVALLQQHGGGAKLLAGGQSLVPVLNFRLSRFEALIDINRLAALAYIRREGATLCIGALTRQRAIERSPLVRAAAPLLAEATPLIAHLPIRSRGTIGGSLAHADPAAEDPAVLLALDAVVVAEGPDGRREIPIDALFLGIFSTSLSPDELITEIRIPAARPGQGFAFEEVSRRRGDFALIGIAAAVELEGGAIRRARIAACGLGDRTQRLTAAEERLRGAAPDIAAAASASAAAEAAADPQSDLHADAAYRRHLVGVLTRRAVTRACAAAEESHA